MTWRACWPKGEESTSPRLERRVDGVEGDAVIQDKRVPYPDFHTVAALRALSLGGWALAGGATPARR